MSQDPFLYGSGVVSLAQRDPDLLTRRAATAVASAMNNDCYALVGGAACAMLGSTHVTM